MTKNSLLTVKNLSISVEESKTKTSVLVNDINFYIYKGEILGLVGESGSGKSLTSLSILRLLPDALTITSGSISFGESQINLLGISEKEIREFRGNKIAMIFQEPMSSLNPLMTCGKQVDEMLKIHTDLNKISIKEKTLDLFDQVKLPDVNRTYNSYPHELSGGQLQRVMISMALICDPDILIADECTTALDVTVQKEILQLLKNINLKRGISILFISHDLEVVADIADRVMVMKKGEIVESGSTKDIFQNPTHSYTQQLISSKPPLDIKLEYLPKPEVFIGSSPEKHYSDLAVEFNEKHKVDEVSIRKRYKEIELADPILTVRNLTKSYPVKKNFLGKPVAFLTAVNDVSFSMNKGETVGLVGESGCGKSTLSKAICRLIDADKGEIKFKNHNLLELKPKELRHLRKEIQYIFQDPYSSLNPRQTIGSAIQEPMKVHNMHYSNKIRKEKTVDLLELVGLSADHYDRYPHEFSGGQRQRICIARSLGLSPDLIVCDEIVSALDVRVKAQVLNLLVDLRKKFDLSLVFVSHDLSIVKFISDRIMVMKNGNIVEAGWAEDIYHRPANDYTKALFSAIPGIKNN